MTEPVRGAKGDREGQDPTRLERTIGRRSAEARATVPELEMTAEVELAAASRGDTWRAAAVVRACARALREHPRANGSYRDGAFELHERINIAVALATGEGFVLATVFDADLKDSAQLEEELEHLASRARAGELAPPELTGSTFAVWCVDGVRSVTPIVTPPHAASLAAGTIRNIPVIREGGVVPGRSLTLTLSCDHRILFWPEAARFLSRIKSLLEDVRE